MALTDQKSATFHCEDVDDTIKPVSQSNVMGTTTINDSSDIVLVPSPSADPRDPLNLPGWRKKVFVALVSVFSAVALCIVSGFGGLLAFYIPEYAEAGATYADISALMTYPTMFMGVGNLVCMPIALAVGRRPVYLFSLVLLIAASILAAYSKDYTWQLGARMALGFATAQTEALVPMMIQEIHFLHERAQYLMWQSALQTIIAAVLVLFASPIAGAIGPGNWYNLGAGLAALTLVLSIFFVPETKYPRSLQAYGQSTYVGGKSDLETNDVPSEPRPVRISERPALDLVNYAPRTVWSDMRFFVNKPDIWEGVYAIRNTFQVCLFPNVLWAFCLNGLTIGTNVAIGTTYGTVMTAGYSWPDKSASYINAGQIVVAIVALPVLGYGSDKLITWMAKRNGGVHEPENRLVLLGFPLVVGVIGAVLYGQASSHPEHYHWFAIVAGVAMYYFAFVGGNIAAITYLLDSYPARAGPCLVVITAFRGFVSFGVSYGTTEFIARNGYDGCFGTLGALTGAFAILAIPIYFYGKHIRKITGKWAVKESGGVPSLSH